MFIRVFRARKQQELLINVGHISLIEVEYAVPGNDNQLFHTVLEDGIADPNAIRIYRIHVGGEQFTLASNPNDPVMKVLEEIHKNAVKGRISPEDFGE